MFLFESKSFFFQGYGCICGITYSVSYLTMGKVILTFCQHEAHVRAMASVFMCSGPQTGCVLGTALASKRGRLSGETFEFFLRNVQERENFKFNHFQKSSQLSYISFVGACPPTLYCHFNLFLHNYSLIYFGSGAYIRQSVTHEFWLERNFCVC